MKWEADRTISEKYFDVVSGCVNNKNVTNMEYFLDYCHLKSSLIYQEILAETLRVVK